MTAVQIQKLGRNDDPDKILDVLDRDGAVVIKNLLGDVTFKQLMGEVIPLFDVASFCEGLYFGRNTKRIHSLIAKSITFRDLAIHPLLLKLARKTLGPFCDKIQINGTQGIQIWPGEAKQILHRDDAKFPLRQMGCEFMINTILACDKFTKENGCTRIALGSHKWTDQSRKATENELSYAEMEPGDAEIFVGSVIHGGGSNQTTAPRAGLVIGYSLGWLRQTENQYLVTPPAVAENLSEELQELLGYSVHRPNLGMYEGNDPQVLLQQNDQRNLVTRDWLTPDQNIRVHQHYKSQQTREIGE